MTQSNENTEAVNIEENENKSKPEFGPAHSSKCDRHLSRIARRFIQKEAIPIIRIHTNHLNMDHHDSKQFHDDEYYYWNVLPQILDHFQTMKQNDENAEQCLLNPKHDVFHHHERNSHEIDSYLRNYPKILHQCGICQKKFVSQFYLDRHLDAHHSNTPLESKEMTSSNDYVCPATDICPILTGGLHKCEEMAMNSNIYYGPGTADGTTHIGRHYLMDGLLSMTPIDFFHHLVSPSTSESKSQHFHSCQESTMEHYRYQCNTMMDNCFLSNANNRNEKEQQQLLSHDLKSHICDRLTCHQNLHILAGHTFEHIHETKEEWDIHHDFRLGRFGGFIVVCICLVYIYFLRNTWKGSDSGKYRKSKNGHVKIKHLKTL